jgi:hypothetical protein
MHLLAIPLRSGQVVLINLLVFSGSSSRMTTRTDGSYSLTALENILGSEATPEITPGSLLFQTPSSGISKNPTSKILEALGVHVFQRIDSYRFCSAGYWPMARILAWTYSMEIRKI